MMRLAAVFVAVALIGAPPAMAQTRSDCPTGQDLQRGVQLTRAAPLFDMVLRKRGATVTEDRTMVRDGRKRRVKTTYLNGLVPLVRREGSQTITLKVLGKNKNFVSGARVQRWSSPIEVYIGSKLLGTGEVKVQPKGNASWTGNGCRYKVKRVVVSTLLSGRPASHFEYFYAPELGISLGGYTLGRDARTRVRSVLPEAIKAR